MSFLVISLIVTAGGIIGSLTHQFSSEQKMIRRYNKMPHTLIQDAVAGQDVRILGNVVPGGEEFISPLTKRRCVYYETIVEDSTDRDSWTEVIREVRGASFFVEDASGRALVKIENVKIEAAREGQIGSLSFQDATAEFEAYLARHGQTSQGKDGNRSLRYREGSLEPGEPIAVLGRVRWEPDPDPRRAGTGYRDVPKRAVMEPLADGSVWVSDILEVAMLGPREPKIEE
jgi:hypothetical protein